MGRRSKSKRAKERGTYGKRSGKGTMRNVTLTAYQFNNFVYPPLGSGNAKGDGDWETALRVMKKLKDPELTMPKALDEKELEAQQEGKPVYAFYKLLDDEATFLLEEDEWRFVRDKVKANRDNVALMAAQDYEACMVAIKDAEKVEVKVEEDDDEAETEAEEEPESEGSPPTEQTEL